MTQRLSYGPLPEQFGELTRPSGHERRPLVILIHGGFWRDQYRLDFMHPMATALNQRGYATWNVEYRRVGPTGGGYPTTLDDVAAAVDHLAEHHLAEHHWQHTAVIGHSAGGHLALWNASRVDADRRPDLTIGLAPVADVIAANQTGVGVDATFNFFGGDYDSVPERYHRGQPNPSEFAGRVVLIHGTADDSVPIEQSIGLEANVARVAILDGVDHFQVIDPTHPCWEIVFDELAKLGE